MKKPRFKKIFFPRGSDGVKDGDLFVGKQQRADKIIERTFQMADFDLRQALEDWKANYEVNEGYYIPGVEHWNGLTGGWVLRAETEPEVNEWGEVGP